MSVMTDTTSGRRTDVSTRVLLLACLPAVVVGLLIRVWLTHTPLSALNADEAITGLQARDVLRGRFRLMVAGNDYGSTTETYLFAPFLAFWGGVWPLRVLPVALYALAAYALYRLARPIFGRVPAAALALIGWTTSGALALMSLHAYMGYTTGLIAQVVALALACHAMRTSTGWAGPPFSPGWRRDSRCGAIRSSAQSRCWPWSRRRCTAGGPCADGGCRSQPAACWESVRGCCSWLGTAGRSRPCRRLSPPTRNG
jgi:hypothetical protein